MLPWKLTQKQKHKRVHDLKPEKGQFRTRPAWLLCAPAGPANHETLAEQP